MIRSPFHAGEQALQERAGVASAARAAPGHQRDPRLHARPAPRVLRAAAVPARRQPRCAAAGRGRRVLAGAPGFVALARRAHPARRRAAAAGDPLAANLAAGAPLGLLGIELATRRRNRMNGTVAARRRGRLRRSACSQSFGNCPQYIQARAPLRGRRDGRRRRARCARKARSVAGGASARRDAPTPFFIASASRRARAAADARRRRSMSRTAAASRGFVRVDRGGRPTVLTVPDFPGNVLLQHARQPRARTRARGCCSSTSTSATCCR